MKMDALCALVAAGAGGEHAVSVDTDLARLTERARLSTPIQSETVSFVSVSTGVRNRLPLRVYGQVPVLIIQ